MAENCHMRFVDAQRTIERSSKAVFELMDVQYPSEHAINPRSQAARNLLQSAYHTVDNITYWEQEQDFVNNKELRRLQTGEVGCLIFLYYMSGNMYELCSYGIDGGDIILKADEFIQFSDYEIAIEYALAALRISDVIITQ